jgi:hypothetical protein
MNANIRAIRELLEEEDVAKKGSRRMTPEERARQLENQARLERVIAKRLEQDGTTREEIERRLGLSEPGR